MTGEASRVCEACGAASPVATRFCAWCGAPAPAPTAAGAPATWGGAPLARPLAGIETYCAHCGRLYPAEAPSCPRCLPVALEERGGTCPRCAHPLEPAPMGDPSSPGATVDRCASCGGSWFDVGEVERVLDLRTQGRLPAQRVAAIRAALARSAAPAGGGGSVACVRCGARTTRRGIAPSSGLMVDLCPAHGIWFDGGELERFREFVAAEGLEIVRRWEEEMPLGRAAVRPWHRAGLGEAGQIPGALAYAMIGAVGPPVLFAPVRRRRRGGW